ncbi:FAD-dependent oxidoreductase, partial [Chloroflexota bacterium]
TIFYRRTRAEMPAAAEEVDAALEEGIEILYLAAPTKVTRENGQLKLECQRMELGEPDASGRRRPVPIEGSEFTTELDSLIAAIGQRPLIPEGLQVETGRGNVVNVDANMMTSREGVFSAGDCQIGPDSVIRAIAGGRKAAEAIDRYLGGDGDISESLVDPEEARHWLNGHYPVEELAHMRHLSPQEAISSFNEVEFGFDADTAMAEAARCLQCHVIAPPNELTLMEAECQFCGACVDACPVGALIECSSRWSGTPDRGVKTICPYCGVGCQLELEIKNEKIVRDSGEHLRQRQS